MNKRKNQTLELWLVRFSPALFVLFLTITVVLTLHRSVPATFSFGAFAVGVLLSIPIIALYISRQTWYAIIYGAGIAAGFHVLNTIFDFFDVRIFISGLFAGVFLPLACGRGRIRRAMSSRQSLIPNKAEHSTE